MTQQAIAKVETGIQTGKRPLVMKSGLVHWLTEETAKNLEQSLATQTANGFIKIRELGITINTAEIGDGILTPAQYADLQKRKAGMWQCIEGNWHEKSIRDCSCHRDRMNAAREVERRERQATEYGPLTPEELEANKERTRRTSEELVLKGILPPKKLVRRSTIIDYQNKGGVVKPPESALNIDEDVL